jgi:hypothetical protein
MALVTAADQTQTDVLARVLAIVALVIGLAGLVLAYRTYRRGGARVKVTVRKRPRDHFVAAFGDEATYQRMIDIRVSNRGLASVQIAEVAVDIRVDGASQRIDAGGPVSGPLAGLHSDEWSVSTLSVLKVPGVSEAKSIRMRAVAQLGDGRTRHSRWISMSTADLSK